MAKNENKNNTVGKEQKFYLNELREHCRTLFDVKPEVFDGAFFNCKDEQVTKEEAQKRIEAFLKKEVKKEDKK
ncbi:hypothetical protein ACQKP0_24735 [Heyndrickxia sp. NPDC080065]|uniref:hypothetical protein n=1 Tax=Heyndrickxia sp. NPDC080065 TaxID=3390568 RepID=UPI003D01D4B2